MGRHRDTGKVSNCDRVISGKPPTKMDTKLERANERGIEGEESQGKHTKLLYAFNTHSRYNIPSSARLRMTLS